MSTDSQLSLPEEILLLALRDKEGTTIYGMYNFALGGAILAELLLHGRVRIVAEKRRKYLDLIEATPLGDDVLDACLLKVKSAKRRASLETWVSRFAGLKDLKHRVARRLCQQGILRADEDKVLLIFTRKIYPEVDPGPERELIERLREAIFTDTPEVAPRTAVLLSLAKSADLLRAAFDRKQLKARKERMARLVNGDLIGKATRSAIEAVQAAVMVAAIMPSIIATTTAHH